MSSTLRRRRLICLDCEAATALIGCQWVAVTNCISQRMCAAQSLHVKRTGCQMGCGSAQRPLQKFQKLGIGERHVSVVASSRPFNMMAMHRFGCEVESCGYLKTGALLSSNKKHLKKAFPAPHLCFWGLCQILDGLQEGRLSRIFLCKVVSRASAHWGFANSKIGQNPLPPPSRNLIHANKNVLPFQQACGDKCDL